MAEPNSLIFDLGFAPDAGTPMPVAPGIVRITAGNAGPFTFTGTNSFLLGSDTLIVVDPGPDDDRHLEALRAGIAGRPVEAILLTHTHRDHCALARRLQSVTGAPLWFAGSHRPSRPRRWPELADFGGSGDRSLRPDRVLADGEILPLGALSLEIIATPGHCANHIAIGLRGTPYLLTGDHIMGWNSTLVSLPDGSMADYFASLDRVLALPYGHYLPAHGGPIAEGPAYARALKAHREMRNGQIVEAVGSGARTTGMVLDRVYPQLRGKLRMAARMMLAAHIDYLEQHGRIAVRRGLFGTRLHPAAS